MVSCCNCADFIPDKTGNGRGIGACKSYDEGMAKNPLYPAIQKARIRRGNIATDGLFWGGDGKRDCKLFKQKRPDIATNDSDPE